MGPLRLSVSQSYVIRVPGITYTNQGAATDPRQLFVVQFQLIDASLDDTAEFGTWLPNGTWETTAPTTGPYAATVTLGNGQPPIVNPGAGTFNLWMRFAGSSETPAFQIPPSVIFSNP